MEVGIGDGQFLPGPNECRDVMSRGERLLDQRNAGGASGAEDAQFLRCPPVAGGARGARERLIIGSFPPLILRLMLPRRTANVIPRWSGR